MTTIWTGQARADLRALAHWRYAEQVSKAVHEYAARGIGFVRRIESNGHPDEWRLYVGSHYARVRFLGDILTVERVVRWRS